MRIGLPGFGTSVDKVVRQAERAEADGFTSLWYASGVAGDPLVAMALAGRATTTIELGTAVLQTYACHPALQAARAHGSAADAGLLTRADARRQAPGPGRGAPTTPTADLVALMAGRKVETVFGPRHDGHARPASALEVEHLSRTGEFEDVSFTVRAGEVVGIAGLVGAGRSEILEAIYGARRPDAGRVLLEGRPLRAGGPPPRFPRPAPWRPGGPRRPRRAG